MTVHHDWLPREITPAETDGPGGVASLAALLSDAGGISDLLSTAKALAFRGFDVAPEHVETAVSLCLRRPLPYVHGNSPRTKVGRNLYTSTEYPPELTISMHNELSYADQWPARLLFYCQTAPATGGATPVVDGARWLLALPAVVRDAFADGIRYTQNLHDGVGFGRSWQQTFETADRLAVEALLAAGSAQWKWLPDGTLRISRTRPATIRHPLTGDEVWFNQADQWHEAALDPDTAQALREVLGRDNLPQSVAFADGSPIPAEYVETIRDTGLAQAVDVDWHPGDLLLIDNIALAHGRRPFTGPRRVLVAMSGEDQ
jgi:alpha-ketoglutarate-dependent taurine dioxygenase